jgi:hypothetical protein
MSSPDELFSNLEVSGQPYASVMQHADLASGLLLLAAFAIAGHEPSRRGRLEWLSMLGFALAGGIGGLFPEVCADGVNAVCRRLEYRLELPASQYIHMVTGIIEFAAITLALLLATRRTRQAAGDQPDGRVVGGSVVGGSVVGGSVPGARAATSYRLLAVGALVGYPLLGAAYLTDRFGGIMEAFFFAGFSIMVITELAERTAAIRATARSAAPYPPALPGVTRPVS